MKLNSFSFHMVLFHVYTKNDVYGRRRALFWSVPIQRSSVPVVYKTILHEFLCLLVYCVSSLWTIMWSLRSSRYQNPMHSYSSDGDGLSVCMDSELSVQCVHECLLTLISWVYVFWKCWMWKVFWMVRYMYSERKSVCCEVYMSSFQRISLNSYFHLLLTEQTQSIHSKYTGVQRECLSAPAPSIPT